MLIKFEKSRCKCCPLSVHGYAVADTEDGKGNIDKSKLRTINIKPGLNIVAPKDYAVLKADQIFKHRVDTRSYEVNEKISGDSINDLDEDSAIDLVNECVDRDILRAWLIKDDRKKVREAIDVQLERVKPEVNDDDDGKAGKGKGK